MNISNPKSWPDFLWWEKSYTFLPCVHLSPVVLQWHFVSRFPHSSHDVDKRRKPASPNWRGPRPRPLTFPFCLGRSRQCPQFEWPFNYHKINITTCLKNNAFVGRGLASMFCPTKGQINESKHLLPRGDGELVVLLGEVCCGLRPEKLDEVLTTYPST